MRNKKYLTLANMPVAERNKAFFREFSELLEKDDRIDNFELIDNRKMRVSLNKNIGVRYMEDGIVSVGDLLARLYEPLNDLKERVEAERRQAEEEEKMQKAAHEEKMVQLEQKIEKQGLSLDKLVRTIDRLAAGRLMDSSFDKYLDFISENQKENGNWFNILDLYQEKRASSGNKKSIRMRR